MYCNCKFIVNKYCLDQHIFKKEDLIMCQAGLGQLVTYKMNYVMSADMLNLHLRFIYIKFCTCKNHRISCIINVNS